MKVSRLFLASCLLLLCEAASLPQQPDQTAAREFERRQLRLSAIVMVRQTASEAPLWDDKKLAVQVLTDAADLLWDETPSQCSGWLKKAWTLTEQVSGSPRDEKLKQFFTRSDQSQLRTMVLSVAQRHDPELAEKLLNQLSQKQSDEKRERGAFDDRSARSEQLLSMAQQVVEVNPEEGFALAQSSLADGISYALQNILTSLRKKNVELANRLFDLALARFSSSAPDPSEAQVLAGYLFQSGFTFSANSGGENIIALNPAQRNVQMVALAEPGRAHAFLVLAYERLLAQPFAVDTIDGKQRAQQTLVLANVIARRYSTFAPELSQSVQGFLAQLQRQLLSETDKASNTETTSRRDQSADSKPLSKEQLYEKTVSDLEDIADRESNELFRNVAYVRAALATKPDDYIRAKKVASKIVDDDLRQDATSFFLYRAALFFVEHSQIEKAAELVPQISDPSRRAVVRIEVSYSLSMQVTTPSGERLLQQQRAYDLLNEAGSDLEKQEPSLKIAKIALGRTAVLAKLDPDQALVALARAVQIINKLDKFDLRDGSAPDLGLGALAVSGATVSRPRLGFDFKSAIDPLIENHLEKVLAITDRLKTKEVAGMARLEAAKLFLRKTNSSTDKQSADVR